MKVNAEKLDYIPILTHRDEMARYVQNDFLRIVIDTYMDYYPRVGYFPPWIGYLAIMGQTCVGVGGFKGRPVNGRVEIAYGTLPEYESMGISSQTCRFLTQLALTEDPELKVTARTLIAESASTTILRKNNYQLVGIVNDPEDGEVWEWIYQPEPI